MNNTSPLSSVDAAMQRIMADVVADLPTETLPLHRVLGRVLAQDCVASVDVPPADNSAMDGYALRMADLGNQSLPIAQRIPAGQSPVPLAENTCARLFTGAESPRGADLVVMQEEATVSGDTVSISGEHPAGAFIRRRGQDVQAGALVAAKGTKLSPRHMGVLASVGVAEATVYRRLKVAVIATGSELVEPGQSLGAGQIYNSNRYQLAGLLEALGFEYVDYGIAKDNAAATTELLQQASQNADIVITSGGVSVGEEDHVKACVEALGELKVWKLAIKPGKPLAFGHVQGTPFFGLPGNPASVLVTFSIIVRPYLLAKQGVDTDVIAKHYQAHRKVHLVNPPRKAGSRQEYLRARIVGEEAGITLVEAMHNQNSGVLSTAMLADGLAVVPIGVCADAAIEVDFLPFNLTI